MRVLSSGTASVIIGVLALTSACGQHAGNGRPLVGKSSGDSSPAATCGGAPLAASHDKTVYVSASDNGKTLCVRRGVGVLVTLHGSPADKWAPIHASSAALSRRANGRLALPVGMTGAYFVAVHPGVSVITSSRAVCGSTPSASPGHTMSCDSRQAYHVTLKIVK
jgi:hypothetical protein